MRERERVHLQDASCLLTQTRVDVLAAVSYIPNRKQWWSKNIWSYMYIYVIFAETIDINFDGIY